MPPLLYIAPLNFHLLQLFCVSKCSSQSYKVVHGPHEEIHSVGWKGLGDKKMKCVSCKALQTENSDHSRLSSVFRSGLLSTLVGEKSVTQRWEVSTGTQKAPWTSQVMVWKCSHSREISLLLVGVLY